MSASPATRLDVMNLQEQLDQKLQQRQARETGICQVRSVYYTHLRIYQDTMIKLH